MKVEISISYLLKGRCIDKSNGHVLKSLIKPLSSYNKYDQ